MQPFEINYTEVNRAFTSQSAHFDADEDGNVVLAGWRERIHHHVGKFIRPSSVILELNAGSGIDAVRFASEGHHVLATDLSDGMIAQLERKAKANDRITVRQLSFEDLDALAGSHFDFVFSNFGGLNCVSDLGRVTKKLPQLLLPNAHITFVIMPRVSPWEWLWVLKGKWKQAFRRFSSNGAEARIDGIRFRAYYHPPATLLGALGPSFKLVQQEALGICSPPPSAVNFVRRFPRLYKFLTWLDMRLGTTVLFNWCGDHIIITLRYHP